MEAIIRPEITIGVSGGDQLKIRLLGRLHPGATDRWDGNWLSTFIDYAVGQFSGSIAASLRSDELLGFRDSLQAMSDSLSGTAVFESMEDWLNLHLTIDAAGRLSLTGVLSDGPGVGNTLQFEIGGLDQSYLREIVEELDEALAKYPVFT